MVNYEGKTLVSRDKKKDFDLLFVLFLFFYLFFFYQSSCEFLPLDQLNSVNFLASSDTQSDKNQKQQNTCQAREGLVETFCNAAANSGCHVVVWLSHVHYINSCVSLHIHHLEFIPRSFHICEFLHFRRFGKSLFFYHKLRQAKNCSP